MGCARCIQFYAVSAVDRAKFFTMTDTSWSRFLVSRYAFLTVTVFSYLLLSFPVRLRNNVLVFVHINANHYDPYAERYRDHTYQEGHTSA